jgi:oligopeptide transport system ATP-binding protein
MKICLHEQPEEIFVAKDHLAACWMNVKAVYDEADKTTTGGDNK